MIKKNSIFKSSRFIFLRFLSVLVFLKSNFVVDHFWLNPIIPLFLLTGAYLMFMRSQKSKPQLVFEGFIYNKKITYSNGNSNWRCADFIKHKCFASCITKDNQMIRRRLEHKHPPPTTKLLNKKLYPTEESLPLQ